MDSKDYLGHTDRRKMKGIVFRISYDLRSCCYVICEVFPEDFMFKSVGEVFSEEVSHF